MNSPAVLPYNIRSALTNKKRQNAVGIDEIIAEVKKVLYDLGMYNFS